MGVKKNIHIENWAGFRENAEHYFKYNRSNFARLAIFGIGVPVGFYVWITKELVCFFNIDRDPNTSTKVSELLLNSFNVLANLDVYILFAELLCVIFIKLMSCGEEGQWSPGRLTGNHASST